MSGRIITLDEGAFSFHGVRFERLPRRYYQRRRNKHSSGDCEWHSRTERLRGLQRAISEFNPCGGATPYKLAAIIREALS